MDHKPPIHRMTILSLALAALPAMAFAQEHAAPLDKWYVSGGVQANPVEFGVRWDYHGYGVTDRGEYADYSDDLGVPYINGYSWEMGATLAGAHRFQAFSWNFGEDSYRRLPNDVHVNGNGIGAGANLRAVLDVDMEGVAYTWFFSRSERHAFGAGVGVVRYGLSSQLDFNVGGFPGSFTIDNDFREEIVMPMVRTEYVRSFARNWRFTADGAYMRRQEDDATGRSTEFNVGVEFLPLRHVSLALRYNATRVDLDLQGKGAEETGSVDADFTGSMRIRHHGPQLVTSLRF